MLQRFLVAFILWPVLVWSGNCRHRLKEISEIYLAARSASLVVRAAPTVPVSRDSREQLEVVRSSPRAATYAKILDLTTSASLRARVLGVLAVLEQRDQFRTIENYESWLDFLQRSHEKDLAHRIFEGLTAALILMSMDVDVAFEPNRGFFFESGLPISPKSMDLRLRFPQNGKVLAYREVKRVYSCRAANGALESALAKADAAKTRAGDDVELSATIYVDREFAPGDPDLYFENVDYAATVTALADHLREHFRRQHGLSLDSLVIVHTGLQRETKLYVQADGSIASFEGNFDPFAELSDQP